MSDVYTMTMVELHLLFDHHSISYILADLKSLYERVTAPKIPSPPHTPRSRRTQADIERDRRERQQEKENREKLRKKEIPPYFESELGRAFLISNAAGMCEHITLNMQSVILLHGLV